MDCAGAGWQCALRRVAAGNAHRETSHCSGSSRSGTTCCRGCMARVLVVEDNTSLAEGIAYNLRHEKHETRIAEDGGSALNIAREWKPELVILDLMIPVLDGYEVLAALRKEHNRVPVIILTAKGEEADKVRGFRLDADQ